MALTTKKNGLANNGGQLTEETQESLNQLAQRTGMPNPTPAGAASQGATPDQSKMARTPAAAKGMRLQETEQGQARTADPRQTATSTEIEDQARAQRLTELNTLGPKVQGLIDQRLQTLKAQQAQLTVNTDYLGKQELTPEQKVAAEAALGQYIQVGDEASALAVAQSLGLQSLTADQLAQYVQGPSAALGALGTATSGETVTLGQLDLSTLPGGLEGLSADLGVDTAALQGMTLQDLNAQIDAVQSQAFNRIAGLQAEYASATPIRQQQITRELADLGAVGVTGTEASVQATEQAAATANVVKIAGQEFTVEQLKEDDVIGGLVTDAANSPEFMAELEKQDPELAQWIKSNQATMQDVIKSRQATGADVRTTQDQYQKWKTASGPLATTLLGELPALTSSADLALLQSNLEAEGVWQAAQADVGLKDLFSKNPELATALKENQWSKEELLEAKMLTDKVASSSVLKALGFEVPESGLITDNLDDIESAQEILTTLGDKITNDPELLGMLQGGQLSLQDMAMVATKADPAYVWQRVKDTLAAQREGMATLTQTNPDGSVVPKEPQDAMDAILRKYGSKTSSVDQINQLVAVLNKIGNKDAAKKIMSTLDANKDGRLNNKDWVQFTNKIEDLMSSGVPDIIDGASAKVDLFSKIANIMGQNPDEIKQNWDNDSKIAVEQAVEADRVLAADQATYALEISQHIYKELPKGTVISYPKLMESMVGGDTKVVKQALSAMEKLRTQKLRELDQHFAKLKKNVNPAAYKSATLDPITDALETAYKEQRAKLVKIMDSNVKRLKKTQEDGAKYHEVETAWKETLADTYVDHKNQIIWKNPKDPKHNVIIGNVKGGLNPTYVASLRRAWLPTQSPHPELTEWINANERNTAERYHTEAVEAEGWVKGEDGKYRK